MTDCRDAAPRASDRRKPGRSLTSRRRLRVSGMKHEIIFCGICRINSGIPKSTPFPNHKIEYYLKTLYILCKSLRCSKNIEKPSLEEFVHNLLFRIELTKFGTDLSKD